jgi:hypothetical protein
MIEVYLVYHTYGDEDEEEDNRKLIGIFSDREKAVEAQKAVADQPGFRDYPEGFEIVEHRLDLLGWRAGFVSIPYDED